jgi:3-deoxy-D-manno-octulosonic-acid transferase
MRKSLETFEHFFVQNKSSEDLLKGIGFSNVTRCGDTRFDRVQEILRADNRLEVLEDFVNDSLVLVAGSTWPKDEKMLLEYINDHAKKGQKFIIAPHQMDRERIKKFKQQVKRKCVLFTEGRPDGETVVFILDTIGLLTRVYSYAHLAYVGGGFDKEGVHNVLEPAVFGAPLVIGPIYDKFQEALDLVEREGCYSVPEFGQGHRKISDLFEQDELRDKMGRINQEYIKEHTGATETITMYLKEKI